MLPFPMYSGVVSVCPHPKQWRDAKQVALYGSLWLFITLFLSCWNKEGDMSAVGEHRVWVSNVCAGPFVLDVGAPRSGMGPPPPLPATS